MIAILAVSVCACVAAAAAVLAVSALRSRDAAARAKEACARELSELRPLFDAADAALVVHSGDGEILEANRGALELFGLPSLEAARGARMSDFSAGSRAIEIVLAEYWKRALEGESPSFEWEIRGPEGAPRPIETVVRRVERGGAAALLATCRDLSPQKVVAKERDAVQAQLLQMQKLDALSKLAGGFANDFNNVLTGVMGTLSVLRMLNEDPEGADGREVGEYLRTAIDSCARAGDLVRQLLTFTRREDSKLVELDVKESLGRVVKICRDSFPKSISIAYRETVAGPMPALGDRAQLEQAMLNVCINAYQAMADRAGSSGESGGEMTVELGAAAPDVRQPAFLPGPDIDLRYARISVTDTGLGFSSEAQKRLFDPFFTTKDKEDGVGLGLSIVYGIMTRHSGTVEIDSCPGRGTTVRLYLPLVGPRPAAAAEPETVVRGEGLILVVDDEKAVRASAEGMLQLCGYRVMTAESGQAGIDRYRERPGEISLVLLDAAMPGKSGHEVLREIREMDDAARIVMMSGFVENEEIDRAIGDGALAFLRKPFSMRLLSRTVKGALEAPISAG